jgi:hypothetical protein
MEDATGSKELVPGAGTVLAPPQDGTPTIDAEGLPAPIANALVPDTAPPPVPEQRSSHVEASKLASEKVVVAAPMSFAGSAARTWRLTGLTAQPGARVALGVLSVILIALAWVIVLAWYVLWGVFLVPYRLIRRGSRKRKREALQHREQLAAIESLRQSKD